MTTVPREPPDGSSVRMISSRPGVRTRSSQTHECMPLDAEDFYFENGLLVFTEAYHRKRGFCCGNNCRHCPYDHANVPAEKAKTDLHAK